MHEWEHVHTTVHYYEEGRTAATKLQTVLVLITVNKQPVERYVDYPIIRIFIIDYYDTFDIK